MGQRDGQRFPDQLGIGRMLDLDTMGAQLRIRTELDLRPDRKRDGVGTSDAGRQRIDDGKRARARAYSARRTSFNAAS